MAAVLLRMHSCTEAHLKAVVCDAGKLGHRWVALLKHIYNSFRCAYDDASAETCTSAGVAA